MNRLKHWLKRLGEYDPTIDKFRVTKSGNSYMVLPLKLWSFRQWVQSYNVSKYLNVPAPGPFYMFKGSPANQYIDIHGTVTKVDLSLEWEDALRSAYIRFNAKPYGPPGVLGQIFYDQLTVSTGGYGDFETISVEGDR